MEVEVYKGKKAHTEPTTKTKPENKMEAMILNAKAIGKEDGIELEQEYRFVAYTSRYGSLSIRPEQSFEGYFTDFSKLPGWTLESLKKNPVDELMIDCGQKWSVSGLLEAIKEATFFFE